MSMICDEVAADPGAGRHRRLVCEGPCNGGLVQQFDAAVTARGRGVIGRDWLWVARQFRHTRHRPDGRDAYICLDCGTRRRYGQGWAIG